MGIEFYIEDKTFTVEDNFHEIAEYTLKSTPRPYPVTVKNNPNVLDEIQKLLDENPKNLLFVDKKVYNLYLKDLKVDSSRVFKKMNLQKAKPLLRLAAELLKMLPHLSEQAIKEELNGLFIQPRFFQCATAVSAAKQELTITK